MPEVGAGGWRRGQLNSAPRSPTGRIKVEAVCMLYHSRYRRGWLSLFPRYSTTPQAGRKCACTVAITGGFVVAVGTGISPCPRTDPGVRLSRTGLCRRSNVTGVRGLAAHAVPVRRQAPLVTCLIRHGVRGMPCHLPSLQPGPFPPPPPPPFITGLFGRFIGTTSPSDSSPVPRQLRLLAFLPRPGIATATAGQTRSPRFQRDPFVRDVASDPGRATAPRMTAPHMLPSTPLTVSAPAK